MKTINNESLLGSGNISITGGNVTVDSSWVANSTNPVQSQLIKSALDGKSDTSHTHSQYSTFDGNYNNLTNKPTIPTMTSQLTNNSGFVSDCTELMSTNFYDNPIFSWDSEDIVMRLLGGISFDFSQTWYNGNELATLTDLDDYVEEATFNNFASNVENKAYKRTSWQNNPSNDYYPSEKLVKDSLDGKSDNGHTHSNYVNPTIADNLTTNDSTQVLSAKQGKVLNDLIGQAISYINQ